MNSSTSTPRPWNPYLYSHDIPLRLHLQRLYRWKARQFKQYASDKYATVAYCFKNPTEGRRIVGHWLRTRLFSAQLLLVLFWAFVLWKNEVTIFQDAINSCSWTQWETWPSDANPHHLVFVADPQLVDAHTYPGRPWPLSSLTILEADVYLRRGFSRIQRDLDPDTVFFLGDLFDGGREWATDWSSSPEEMFKAYDNAYWMHEYRRFTHLFFRDYGQRPGQRLIASLPGNHDLGFAQGVQIPVRDRFEMMFGSGNRVDIIANHTFVSIDSVSLSARDEEGGEKYVADIWQPTWDFLEHAQVQMLTTTDTHLRTLAQEEPGVYHQGRHFRQEVDEYAAAIQPLARPAPLEADFPNILLTHVPLYRPAGTPCGPLRERHPPSPPEPGQTSPPEFDERNALTIARGYQYQNVISQDLTKHIIDKLGGAISYAFSGDDHDYCEVVHRAYASPGRGIREITVKSLSFTMGVRRPGFVMVSMWNPVDANGKRIISDTEETLQTHLCLLPDQLGIFIRYALLLGVSVAILLVRSFLVIYVPSRFGDAAESELSLLPMHGRRKDDESMQDEDVSLLGLNGAHAAVSSHERAEMFARGGARTRGSSISKSSESGNHSNGSGATSRSKIDAAAQSRRERVRRTKPVRMLKEWGLGIWRVAWVVVLWFLWLQRTY